MQVLSNLLNAPTRVHHLEAKFKKLSAHTEADRCHMGRMWDWDLVWSCFHCLVLWEMDRNGWTCQVADNLNDDPALWLSISCSYVAGVCRLNGHILRLVDVLDIQTSSICSWLFMLRFPETTPYIYFEIPGDLTARGPTKHSTPSSCSPYCHYAAAWWGRQIERFLYVRISRIDFLFAVMGWIH